MAFRSPTNPLDLLDQSYRNASPTTMPAPAPTFHGGPTPAPSPITGGRGSFDMSNFPNRNTPNPNGTSMPAPTPTFHGGPGQGDTPNRFGRFQDFLANFGGGRLNNYAPVNEPQGPHVPYTPLPTSNPGEEYNDSNFQYKGGAVADQGLTSKAPYGNGSPNSIQNPNTGNTTYNHLGHASPSARYQAWVAAGKPVKDVNGYDLDNQGNYVNAMFDQQYVKQNANQLGQAYVDRFYQNNPGFATEQGAGVNSIDPWSNFETQNGGVFAGGSAANPNTSINGITLGQGGGLIEMIRRFVEQRGGSFNMPRSNSPISSYNPNTPSGTPSGGGPKLLSSSGLSPTNDSAAYAGTASPNFKGGMSTSGTTMPEGTTSTGSSTPPSSGNVNTNTNTNLQPPDANGNVVISGPLGFNINTGHFTMNGQEVANNYESTNNSGFFGSSGFLNYYGPGSESSQFIGASGIQYFLDRPNIYTVGPLEDRQESGGQGYQVSIKPEVLERYNATGMVQLPQTGIGGFSEVIDPSKVVFHPEFGAMTYRDNIGAPDPGPRRRMRLLAALGIGGMLGAELLFPAAGGGAAGAGLPFGATVPTITGEGALPFLTQPAMEALTGAVTVGGGSSLINSLGTGAAALIRPIVNAVTGGGSGGSGGGINLGNLGNLISGIGGNASTNHNLGLFQTLVNQMLQMGAPYANERAGAIARLRNLEQNPGQIESNPLFSAMNDKSQKDLARRYSSRGLNTSGAEMAGLQDNFLANFDNFYGKEWERLAREAGVYFDPTGMASAGMRAGSEMYGARQTRDNALGQILGLGNSGNNSGAGDLISQIIGSIFGNNNSDGNDDEYWDWIVENIWRYGSEGE